MGARLRDETDSAVKKDARPGKLPQAPFENSNAYKAAHQVLVDANTIVARMKKEYRLVAGTRIADRALLLAEAVAMAYMEKNQRRKLAHLRHALQLCASVYALHRMAGALNVCSHDMYKKQIEGCIDVMQQVQKWMADCTGSEDLISQPAPQGGAVAASHGPASSAMPCQIARTYRPKAAKGADRHQPAPAHTMRGPA